MQVLKTLPKRILHFWPLGSPRISGVIWVLIAFFCRLYILLCILSINAFGHFGLGKCKLVTLRCRFHANNAGLGDLTMGILHFWPLGFLANSGIIWFLIVLFCRLYIFCAFFPAMPLDILALENVSWWYWGPGSTAQNAGFEDLTKKDLTFLAPRIP